MLEKVVVIGVRYAWFSAAGAFMALNADSAWGQEHVEEDPRDERIRQFNVAVAGALAGAMVAVATEKE
jgi:hypothetical protein